MASFEYYVTSKMAIFDPYLLLRNKFHEKIEKKIKLWSLPPTLRDAMKYPNNSYHDVYPLENLPKKIYESKSILKIPATCIPEHKMHRNIFTKSSSP